MMDLTSNNDLMSEKTGHGDNALLDTRNTGKSIILYLEQLIGMKTLKTHMKIAEKMAYNLDAIPKHLNFNLKIYCHY